MSETSSHTATCLGCGCACDDVRVTVADNRITHLANACPLGQTWLGTGELPQEICINGASAPLDSAIAALAQRLYSERGKALIYVAGDLSLTAQRHAIALADVLHTSIDGVAADTVAAGHLAAARRGRVSATLGELRHRADTILWWNVSLKERYPHFAKRFLDAPSQHASQRRQIAIEIENPSTLQSLEERIPLESHDELDFISQIRCALAGQQPDPAFPAIPKLVETLKSSQYVGIIYDAEPNNASAPDRTEALLALGNDLCDHTRAAVWGLRAGGNRNGFEAALTWQTGFPMSVDFQSGAPRFVATESVADRLNRGRYAFTVILGNPNAIPDPVRHTLEKTELALVGPHASTADLLAQIIIDTGSVAIHEPGIILRMDDVPLEAESFLTHPHALTDVLSSLQAHCHALATEAHT